MTCLKAVRKHHHGIDAAKLQNIDEMEKKKPNYFVLDAK